MTSREVVDILGTPDRVSKRGNRYKAYEYIDRTVDGRSLGAGYVVIFKDDRVEADGPGRLREAPSASMGMFTTIPFK